MFKFHAFNFLRYDYAMVFLMWIIFNFYHQYVHSNIKSVIFFLIKNYTSEMDVIFESYGYEHLKTVYNERLPI